jgi:hypothetical protein
MDDIQFITAFLDSTLLEDLDKEEIMKMWAIVRDETFFDSWFRDDPNKIDNHRVAITLPPKPHVKLDYDLEEMLKYFKSAGCSDFDLLNGYMTTPRGRRVRIGRILAAAKKKPHPSNPWIIGYYREQVSDALKDPQVEAQAISRALKGDRWEINYHLKEHIKYFTDREKVGLVPSTIIISNHPVDIARMSEGRKVGKRGWDTCTNPRDYHKVWFEILTGGFVAYSVPDDYEIDPKQGIVDPLGRLHIRKFIKVDPDTDEVLVRAVPENAIFPKRGGDPSGRLIEATKEWIKSKGQYEFDIDDYDLAGSQYSDTYLESKRILKYDLLPQGYAGIVKKYEDHLDRVLGAYYGETREGTESIPFISIAFTVVSAGKPPMLFDVQYASPEMGKIAREFDAVSGHRRDLPYSQVEHWRIAEPEGPYAKWTELVEEADSVRTQIENGDIPIPVKNAISRIPLTYLGHTVRKIIKGLRAEPSAFKAIFTVAEVSNVTPRSGGQHVEEEGERVSLHYFTVEEGVFLDGDNSPITQAVAMEFIRVSRVAKKAFHAYRGRR